MKLFLDDIRMPSDVGLDNNEWAPVRDALTAWILIQSGVVTHLSLDHDLGCDENGKELATGYDLCKLMAEHDKWPSKSVYIHSQNPVGKQAMFQLIERYFLGIRY